MSAEHAVFKSAGLTSFGGILFSVVGTFVLLPPLLRRLFRLPAERATRPTGGLEQAFRAARRRFRHFELRPRLAAWRRLRPGGLLRAFPLPEAVAGPMVIFPLRFGVEAAWLAEALPGQASRGADPDNDNIRLAARVGGSDADFRTGGIEALAVDGPEAGLVMLPGRPPERDDVSMLLAAADRCLAPGGRLVVLAGQPSERPAWSLMLNRLTRSAPDPYDSPAVEAFLEKQGYGRIERRPAGDGSTLTWIAAVKV